MAAPSAIGAIVDAQLEHMSHLLLRLFSLVFASHDQRLTSNGIVLARQMATQLVAASGRRG